MRAVRVSDASPVPAVVLDSAPQPEPGAGELLIRVCAVGVTPTELIWYPTSHTRSGQKRMGAIPAHEFSGIVAAIGAGVTGIEAGQAMFGMNDWFAEGAMADYCVAPASAVVLKPPRLSHAEAASVPIGALTAWQGLMDRAKLQAGDRVLVHGGAGAVGVFAVQLARLHGAHVIATASEANAAFVKGLGAEQVIDYRESRFEERVAAVDIVFDTVGGETLRRSWGVLAPQGRMVTIAADVENTTDQRVKDAFFIVEPNGKQLAAIADLLEAGKLRPVVDAVAPFSSAPEAYAGKARGSRRGKVVVAVAESQ